MYKNIEEITKQIAERDPGLAEIFRVIAGQLIEEPSSLEDRTYENSSGSKGLGEKIKEKGAKIIKEYSNSTSINLIPSDVKGTCHTECICFAFDKWRTQGGFYGIVERIKEYWLICPNNLKTIIFTTAWDEIDFIEKFKPLFDFRTRNSGKMICVVLVGLNGNSVTYLR
jgi:hypothetical protein